MNNISYIFDDYQWTCVGNNLIGDMVYPPQSNKCAIMLSKVLNTRRLNILCIMFKIIAFYIRFWYFIF